jgi:signal-transduction protein with cAMP-binding, CBS, and nucleotidyltransferase domain
VYRGRTIRREHIIKILEWYDENLKKTVAELVPAGVTSKEISGLLAKLKKA